MPNEEKDKQPKETVVHIDKKLHKITPPVTGQVLYQLGAVDSSLYDLWLEARGQGDDILVTNSNEIVELENGAQLYSMQKNLNPGAFHEQLR